MEGAAAQEDDSEYWKIKASACSKVLLTGAYLIIDPKYKGLVLATDARFHTSTLLKNNDSKNLIIQVTSKQFGLKKIFEVKFHKGGKYTVHGMENKGGFIEKCVYFLATIMATQEVLESMSGCTLQIDLAGDNSFYSQRDQFDSPSFTYENLAKQSPLSVPSDPSKKTGLGSSAALIVSFIASSFSIAGILARGNMKAIHIYAQILNAFVQEKVGSGFDIACSVYGSQIYSRFRNVKELTELVSWFQEGIKSGEVHPGNDTLFDFFDTFDWELQSFTKVPKDLGLCLIDVNSGSDTKLMVKKVLDWAKANQSKEDDMFSNDICSKLNANYDKLASSLAQDMPNQETIQSLCLEIRSLIQTLSQQTEVPIEPPSSTLLLDSILKNLDYTYYAAVPGAGGNDAIFVIGKGDKLHENIQRDICNKYQNEEGSRIAVLPVKVLREKEPALIIQ
ncbi:hypothetical protein FGO68_gene7895 [Halteria grandinella]|uniref:phosphomevalonate kinase n=1 Tax=Halteria grandinella TaxID=5974 RepID=A0A8J8NXF9_HALGN|nr:hypothetical protein FGO68_gene7895 [Halteria grandinella]